MTPTTAPTADPVYFDLGQTATYKRRRAGWFAGRGEHTDDRAGTMRLVLEKKGRSNDADDVDEYGLQEEHLAGRPPGVRVFLLRNDTDPSQPDVYQCVIGTAPGGEVHDACTCRAGLHGKECKHRAALSKLIEKGVI